LLVEIVDIVERFKRAFRDCLQGALNRLDDIEKADPAIEESVDRSLVGRIEHRRAAATADECLARDAQSRETVLVRGLEGKAPNSRQIEPLGWGFNAAGPSERVGDWRPHIGRTELS
jgi:hypothetical protein